MSSPQLETFLARLYTDTVLREAFLHDPRASAANAALADDDVEALCRIDRIGLQMAANSFAKKRESYRKGRHSWWQRLLRFVKR
jgi:hypothetical protein